MTVRELPQIEHDDKVSIRFKRMTTAVNAAIAHDDKAPLMDTREASASAQPA
jgi:hypothetical protein